MPLFKNQKSEFRHRGFRPADPMGETIMIFGNDAEPLNPDGTPMTKLWDHDVVSETRVADHDQSS